jgi:prophage antirepressor-like protein
MSGSAIIDLYNGILEYNRVKMILVTDKNNMTWFSAMDIAKIMEYSNPHKAIQNNVKNHQKKSFEELEKFFNIIPSNMQPKNSFYK